MNADVTLLIDTAETLPEHYSRLMAADETFSLVTTGDCFGVPEEEMVYYPWEPVTRDTAEIAKERGRPYLMAPSLGLYAA